MSTRAIGKDVMRETHRTLIRLLEEGFPKPIAREALSAATGMRGVLVDDTLRDLRDLGLAREVQDVAEYGREHPIRKPADVLWTSIAARALVTKARNEPESGSQCGRRCLPAGVIRVIRVKERLRRLG